MFIHLPTTADLRQHLFLNRVPFYKVQGVIIQAIP